MKTKSSCPVCGEINTDFLLERRDLITMQNYVYRDEVIAKNAKVGNLEFRSCPTCEFAFNARFDPALMTYDENYDNLVPSQLFTDYYRSIARFLYHDYSLEGKLIVDVGCGKGTFIKILCEMYPGVRGLGIDPSYESSESDRNLTNLSFIPDFFKKEYLDVQPALVICRHVLEHIDEPVQFLRAIGDTLKDYRDTPFFIEVPDLEWIVNNKAFWDFCYEHCNYFTLNSLRSTLKLAGFIPLEWNKAFGGQYLWMKGVVKDIDVAESPNQAFQEDLRDYASTENSLMENAGLQLSLSRADGNINIIWGMSTKGVVFCNLIDLKKNLIDYCIDINPNKHRCYVPRSAHLISPPEILGEIDPSANIMVVVMNPNYFAEIKERCSSFNLKVKFIDAAGTEL